MDRRVGDRRADGVPPAPDTPPGTTPVNAGAVPITRRLHYM